MDGLVRGKLAFTARTTLLAISRRAYSIDESRAIIAFRRGRLRKKIMERSGKDLLRRRRNGEGICVAILVAATLCSVCRGQMVLGTDWLKGLSQNIEALNRNIQENVQQVNRRVQETVQGNLQQVRRLTENLNEELGPVAENAQIIGGGGNVFLSSNDGTKIVHSGRTSDGKPFVRETTDKIVADTLRHVERIYNPTTNTSRVYGYTLDLKDPHAKPVPINGDA